MFAVHKLSLSLICVEGYESDEISKSVGTVEAILRTFQQLQDLRLHLIIDTRGRVNGTKIIHGYLALTEMAATAQDSCHIRRWISFRMALVS